MEDKLYQTVVNYIKEEIYCDRLRIGNKLPTERELSAKLELSRNSIREALRTLSSLGIIESRQGSGNYLAGDINKFFSESFSMITLMNKTTPQEICQMRRALEIQAFTIMSGRLTQEQITELEQMTQEMETVDVEQRPAIDLKFHQRIIELCGNSIMAATCVALSSIFLANVDSNLKILSKENLKTTQQCHRDIVEAYRNKDLNAGLTAIARHYDLVDEALN